MKLYLHYGALISIPCRSHLLGPGKEGMYAVLGDGGKDVPSALSVKSSTVKPLFIVSVWGLKKRQWIQENNRCGSHS
jgi:hypothetical protein